MNSRKGFTLIELLIVVAIIGVLVTMMLPSFQGIQRAVKENACRANLNALGKAMLSYMNQFDGGPTLGETTAYDEDPEGADKLGELFVDSDDAVDQADSNLQNYYLLVSTGVAGEDSFRCPADETYEPVDRDTDDDGTQDSYVGFTSPNNSSYALQLTVRADKNAAWLGAPDQVGDMPIAADKPQLDASDKIQVDDWNANHNESVTNMVRRSGNVKSNDNVQNADGTGNKNLVGVYGNNIYKGDLTSEDPPELGDISGDDWTVEANDSFLYWDGEF